MAKKLISALFELNSRGFILYFGDTFLFQGGNPYDVMTPKNRRDDNFKFVRLINQTCFYVCMEFQCYQRSETLPFE